VPVLRSLDESIATELLAMLFAPPPASADSLDTEITSAQPDPDQMEDPASELAEFRLLALSTFSTNYQASTSALVSVVRDSQPDDENAEAEMRRHIWQKEVNELVSRRLLRPDFSF
jgi:hypothetical protein